MPYEMTVGLHVADPDTASGAPALSPRSPRENATSTGHSFSLFRTAPPRSRFSAIHGIAKFAGRLFEKAAPAAIVIAECECVQHELEGT